MCVQIDELLAVNIKISCPEVRNVCLYDVLEISKTNESTDVGRPTIGKEEKN